MKRKYLPYAGLAVISLFIYINANTTEEVFVCLTFFVFFYIMYLVATLAWSLIRRKHTWRTKLKRGAVATVALIITLIACAVTESPEEEQVYRDSKAQEIYDKQAQYEEWQDYLTQEKAYDDQAQYEEWQDYLAQKAYDDQAQYEEWQDYLAQKAYDDQVQYEEWQDYLAQKAYDDQAQYEEWQDYLAQKAYDDQAQYEEWQDYLEQKAHDDQYERRQKNSAQKSYNDQAAYEAWMAAVPAEIERVAVEATPSAKVELSDNGDGLLNVSVTYKMVESEALLDSYQDTEYVRQAQQLIGALYREDLPISSVTAHGYGRVISQGHHFQGEAITVTVSADKAKIIDWGRKSDLNHFIDVVDDFYLAEHEKRNINVSIGY